MARSSDENSILSATMHANTDARQLAIQSRQNCIDRRHPHEQIQGICLPTPHRQRGGGRRTLPQLPLLRGAVWKELPAPREKGGGGVRCPLR